MRYNPWFLQEYCRLKEDMIGLYKWGGISLDGEYPIGSKIHQPPTIPRQEFRLSVTRDAQLIKQLTLWEKLCQLMGSVQLRR